MTDLLADDRDERVARELAGDRVGEPLAVDGERGAGGYAARFCGLDDERPKPPHFFFEETHGVIELVAAERVAAHQLGEPIGFVDGRGTHRPHFVQRDRHALRGGLPRRLGTSQAAADDLDHV